MSAAFSDFPHPAVHRAGRGARAGALWRERLAAWLQRRRERCELLKLNERELRDIGITRCDALREAAKPLWRD
jgi:uncharacterized protein YjiS (DUF1127 family)